MKEGKINSCQQENLCLICDDDWFKNGLSHITYNKVKDYWVFGGIN
jgi:hypothetical protein